MNICEFCGEVFEGKPERRFCSLSCANKGKHYPASKRYNKDWLRTDLFCPFCGGTRNQSHLASYDGVMIKAGLEDIYKCFHCEMEWRLTCEGTPTSG